MEGAKREFKQLVVQVAEVKLEPTASGGTIEGYANVKGVVDAYGDRVVDGAYKNLDKLIKDGWLALSHDWDDLQIGFIIEAREDPHGLYFKAGFHTTDDAQAVRTTCLERIAAGKTVAFSIGYFATDYEFVTENNAQIRLLKGIEVFEISIVTMPANADSICTDAKASPGQRLGDQVSKAVDLVADLTTRCEWIAANRKTGLSEERTEALKGLIAGLDSASAALSKVIATSPETPENSDDEEPTAEEIAVLEALKNARTEKR